jgi:HEAT repeat protein
MRNNLTNGLDLNVDFYITALEKGDKITRSFAAELLGEIGDKKALEPLKKALTDAEEIVRVYASKSLSKLDKPTAKAS